MQCVSSFSLQVCIFLPAHPPTSVLSFLSLSLSRGSHLIDWKAAPYIHYSGTFSSLFRANFTSVNVERVLHKTWQMYTSADCTSYTKENVCDTFVSLSLKQTCSILRLVWSFCLSIALSMHQLIHSREMVMCVHKISARTKNLFFCRLISLSTSASLSLALFSDASFTYSLSFISRVSLLIVEKARDTDRKRKRYAFMCLPYWVNCLRYKCTLLNQFRGFTHKVLWWDAHHHSRLFLCMWVRSVYAYTPLSFDEEITFLSTSQQQQQPSNTPVNVIWVQVWEYITEYRKEGNKQNLPGQITCVKII